MVMGKVSASPPRPAFAGFKKNKWVPKACNPPLNPSQIPAWGAFTGCGEGS